VRHAPYLAIYDLTDFPPDLLEMQAEDSRKEEEKAAGLFANTVADSDISHEWVCAEGPPLDVITDHARFCDLLVIGQGNLETAHLGDLPGSLILSAGRPVLIVPTETSAKHVGRRVMVGWDASAPAARAVNDALPLLAGADEVDILAINPDTGEQTGEPIRCEDIGRHLARHGIKAGTQSITVDDVGVADMLLSRATDQDIDLFVMGAYGHPRWRELVLGGVTAHMLEHMTMPVLMAH
jgi:nucleotide-binding universal stress UspA family protein